MPQPPSIQPEDLVDRYDGLLLDAFGVLVDGSGALRSGERILAALTAAGKPYFVVTNDASRLPETASRRFRSLSLDIPPDRILSSGSLLVDHFQEHELRGATCRVLGPEDSRAYVRLAGGEPLPLDSNELPEAVVICDERGFPYLEGLDHTLTLLLRAYGKDRQPHLVLANPDLHFPHAQGSWGFTAGSLALLLEAALDLRFPPGEAPRFHRLGKPGPKLLETAKAQMSCDRVAMVGDQISTDIASAHAAGMHSVLVGDIHSKNDLLPNFLLAKEG